MPSNLCVRNAGLTGGGFLTSLSSGQGMEKGTAPCRNAFVASRSDLVLWTCFVWWFCCYNGRINDSLLSHSGGVSGSPTDISYNHLELSLLRYC